MSPDRHRTVKAGGRRVEILSLRRIEPIRSFVLIAAAVRAMVVHSFEDRVMVSATELPAGCMLIERDGLPPGCMLLKWADGEIDVVGADLAARATVRFDPDVETWAIFAHDRPHMPSAAHRPRGRRLAAAADPERLLVVLSEETELAEVA